MESVTVLMLLLEAPSIDRDLPRGCSNSLAAFNICLSCCSLKTNAFLADCGGKGPSASSKHMNGFKGTFCFSFPSSFLTFRNRGASHPMETVIEVKSQNVQYSRK